MAQITKDTIIGDILDIAPETAPIFLNGLSYSEIAAEVNKSPKSVDNAVQRIRRKLAQQSSSGDVSVS